jgi:hypothetical protein
VGNSPLNFTDPSGYCFLGCFWKNIGKFLKENIAAIIQVAATALICGPGAPICAGVVAFAVTGVTSGNLGLALRAGFTAFFTAVAFDVVGTATLGAEHKIPDFLSSAHLSNMAGHALVGCASAVLGGSKCGPGALSGLAGSFAGPILQDLGFQRNLVAHAVVGGLASVAGGGKFANGAVTAAFGYLFNQAAGEFRRMAENAETYQSRLAVDDAQSKLNMCLADCAAQQYHAELGVIGGLLVALGFPLPKSWFGIATPMGASPNTNLLSLEAHEIFLREGKATDYARTLRAAGRVAPVAGAGVLLYDGHSISQCAQNCPSNLK